MSEGVNFYLRLDENLKYSRRIFKAKPFFLKRRNPEKPAGFEGVFKAGEKIFFRGFYTCQVLNYPIVYALTLKHLTGVNLPIVFS